MRKSLQLKEQRDEQLKVANQILESATDEKPITDEQRALFDSLMAKVEILNGDIKRAEFVEINQPTAAVTDADPKRPKPVIAPQASGRIEMPGRMRAGKLRAFQGENAEENAYKAGQWVLATLYNQEKAQKFCASNGIPMIRNAQTEGNNTQGGFIVPDVMERSIIDLREQYGTFRSLARIFPMSSDYQVIPRRASGLTAYPIGEGVSITESEKGWTNVTHTARKWAVLVRYSSELNEDAIISIADDLSQEAAYAFAYAEDNAGFNGDGSNTYHGITGVVTKFQAVIGAGQLAGAVDAASGHDTFAEIDATDLVTLTAKLPKYALGRARWVCSQPAWSLVFQRLQAAAGGNTVAEVAGKMQYQYLGYPIEISQLMPTSTGDLSDKVMLLFGDFGAAVSMGTRRGVTLSSSSERYFETDQLAIRGTERFDINVHDIGDTTTAGPLVALIGE